ncbi:MAG: hypothetical protein OWR62_10275 [Sulfobacillus thermotolerans]|nr:hypothetical protein [Sulfobacillus thermotolerans]
MPSVLLHDGTSVPHPTTSVQRLEAYFGRITVTDNVGANYEELGAATGTVDGDHTVSPPVPAEATEQAVVVEPNCMRTYLATGSPSRPSARGVPVGPSGDSTRRVCEDGVSRPLRATTDINNTPVLKHDTASTCLTLLRISRVRGL